MSGVDFIDVSNPAKPASLGSFFLDGYARAVAAAGLIAAAVDAPTGLYLFDFTKAARLEVVGTEQSADCPVLVAVTSTNGSSTPKCCRACRVGHSADLRHLRAGGASKVEHLQHAGRASRARGAAKVAGLRGRPREWARDCGSRGARVTSRCQHLQNADAGA